MARPRVTAGFRCAPGLPQAIAVKTPEITAIAQPVVMTIQPEFSAFDFFNNTPATTPSPIRINTSVPMNSPNQGESIYLSSVEFIRHPISHSFPESAIGSPRIVLSSSELEGLLARSSKLDFKGWNIARTER